MVWIHGGGLVTGGSFLYDPSPLVTQGNLMVVTINYRLGYPGFFAHRAIDAGAASAPTTSRTFAV
jgi:para-nitrobenzyl esterase